jgi:hypothetical protein
MNVLGIHLDSLGRFVVRAGGTVADLATNALAGLSGHGDDDSLIYDPWLCDDA